MRSNCRAMMNIPLDQQCLRYPWGWWWDGASSFNEPSNMFGRRWNGPFAGNTLVFCLNFFLFLCSGIYWKSVGMDWISPLTIQKVAVSESYILEQKGSREVHVLWISIMLQRKERWCSRNKRYLIGQLFLVPFSLLPVAMNLIKHSSQSLMVSALQWMRLLGEMGC